MGEREEMLYQLGLCRRKVTHSVVEISPEPYKKTIIFMDL